MPRLDVTDDDLDLMRRILRRTIAASRFPLSTETRACRALLQKLEGKTEPASPHAGKKPR